MKFSVDDIKLAMDYMAAHCPSSSVGVFSGDLGKLVFTSTDRHGIEIEITVYQVYGDEAAKMATIKKTDRLTKSSI